MCRKKLPIQLRMFDLINFFESLDFSTILMMISSVGRERISMLVLRQILTFTMSYTTISLGRINLKISYVGEITRIPSICLGLKSLTMGR